LTELGSADGGDPAAYLKYSNAVLPYTPQSWFEAAAASGLVYPRRTDDGRAFPFVHFLRVHGRISATRANREQLGDFLSRRQKLLYACKRSAKTISIQARHDDTLAKAC